MVVAADGSGDFNTVQGAIDFAPGQAGEARHDLHQERHYEEIVYLSGKSNLTIRGEDRESVQVGYPNNSAFNRRAAARRAARLLDPDATDIQLSTFTINNYFIGQAEALLVRGQRIVIDRMTLNGSGDALTTYGTIYMVDTQAHRRWRHDPRLRRAVLPALRDPFGRPVHLDAHAAGQPWQCVRGFDVHRVDKPLPWTVNADGTGGGSAGRVRAAAEQWPDGAPGANFPYAEMVLINAKTQGVPAEGWGPVEEPPGVRQLERSLLGIQHDGHGRPPDRHVEASSDREAPDAAEGRRDDRQLHASRSSCWAAGSRWSNRS